MHVGYTEVQEKLNCIRTNRLAAFRKLQLCASDLPVYSAKSALANRSLVVYKEGRAGSNCLIMSKVGWCTAAFFTVYVYGMTSHLLQNAVLWYEQGPVCQ